jgi:hypothetical protein
VVQKRREGKRREEKRREEKRREESLLLLAVEPWSLSL